MSLVCQGGMSLVNNGLKLSSKVRKLLSGMDAAWMFDNNGVRI